MLKPCLALFALILILPVAAVANDSADNRESTAYTVLLEAECQLLETELSQQQLQLAQLEKLRAQGHASWLEVRRQQLKTDSLKSKTESFKTFVEFVRRTEHSHSAASIYAQSARSIGSLTFTDLRIQTDQPGEQLDVFILDDIIAQSQKELGDLKDQRVEVAEKFHALPEQDPWKVSYEQRVQLMRDRVRVASARVAMLKEIRQQVGDDDDDGNSDQNLAANCIAGGQSSEALQAAAIRQCKAHGDIIRHSLQHERKRLEKVLELVEMEMASKEDVEILQDQIEQLLVLQDDQQLVIDYLQNQNLSQVFSRPENSKQQYVSTVANKKRAFPPADKIRQEFRKFEASFQKRSATLELEMLSEVLARLEVAAEKSFSRGPTDEFSKSLLKGQQTELENYRWRIRLAELEVNLADRRLEVIDLQHDSGDLLPLHFVKVQLPEINPNFAFGLSASSLMNVLTVSHSNPGLLTRKGNSLPASLINSDPFGLLPVRFRSCNSNYRPVRLTDSSRLFSNYYRSPIYSRNSRSVFSYFGRSYCGGGSSYYRNQCGLGYSRYGSSRRYSSYGFGYSRSGYPYLGSGSSLYRTTLPTFSRAYNNGIIRSSFRPYLSVGQIPWYLPGSPTNLRYSQLQTSRLNSFGYSGSSLLRSKIYTDLWGR